MKTYTIKTSVAKNLCFMLVEDIAWKIAYAEGYGEEFNTFSYDKQTSEISMFDTDTLLGKATLKFIKV